MITLELNQRDTCENNIRIFFQEANSCKIDYQVLLVNLQYRAAFGSSSSLNFMM